MKHGALARAAALQPACSQPILSLTARSCAARVDEEITAGSRCPRPDIIRAPFERFLGFAR